MIGSLSFQICSLFYTVLLYISFFTKEKIKNFENKIFGILIVSNVVGLVLDIVTTYMAYVDVSFSYLNILCKIYLIYLIFWVQTFTYYTIVISCVKRDTTDRDKKQLTKKLFPYIAISFIISSIIILIIPLYNFSENGVIYTYGAGANFSYIIVGIAIIIWLVCVCANIKNIKEKKYIPIFVLIIIGCIVVILQNMYPHLLLVTSAACFVTFLMYFTIENPDLKLINELNISREQAEKANSAKTDFLSNMSHEIRTPLNAIVGFSQSLSEQDIPLAAKDDVHDIIMASENLLEIVNGILDISKIEANKLEIMNNKYNLQKVLDELIVLTKGRLGDKPLDFRFKFDPGIPPVLYGDYTRIKQIILNLLTNSVKYTRQGFVEFKVDSFKKGDICRLIISVEDSGIGIKKDKIDKLFNKFERVDVEKNISIEGTGLGLAIAKRLVELMNGQIVVQSIYGNGSKFTVAIDQKIAEGEAVNINKDEVKHVDGLDLSHKKVLLVDDNRVNLKVAARLLSIFDLQIDQVQSGQECLDKINAGEYYDLIFMDDMMPRMSGVETFKRLKENDSFKIPTIALTANAIAGMKEKYLKQGFNDYLSKPINREELNIVVNKYLNK